jgi:hypothetical protein
MNYNPLLYKCWTLLTKLINENRIDWGEHMFIMLFSYRIADKVTTWILAMKMRGKSLCEWNSTFLHNKITWIVNKN